MYIHVCTGTLYYRTTVALRYMKRNGKLDDL